MSEHLTPWSEPVLDEWIDYNGHLSEAYYVLVFGHATDSVMAQLGMTTEYVETTNTSLFTLEAHVRYLDQIEPGAHLQVNSSVIGVGGKTVWLWHEMVCDGRLRATEEILAVHVDTTVGGSTPLAGPVAERARAFLVSPPPDAGRAITAR